MSPKVVSLFAGSGGSCLGYHLAGFEVLLGIDWDKHAVKYFELNHGAPIWQKDIANVSGQEILAFCGLLKGELDVLDASPPCQGYSTAGSRRLLDERNDLFWHFKRLVEEIEPKVFVMENVPGLVQGKYKGLFVNQLMALKQLPYRVKCKLMNSKYYQVPQSRCRLIFMGVHDKLGIDPSYPVPHNAWITFKEAVSDLRNLGITKTSNLKLKIIISNLKPGQGNSDQMSFTMRRAYYSRPCPTIMRTPNLFHPFENRFLSINECKVLSSFPESWELGDNFTIAWNLIGNAVMPRFMQAIAGHIKKSILGGNNAQ